MEDKRPSLPRCKKKGASHGYPNLDLGRHAGEKDEYAVFQECFTLGDTCGPVVLEISADSAYAVYLNGTLAASAKIGAPWPPIITGFYYKEKAAHRAAFLCL